MRHEEILILDFGSPYTQAVARQIRNAQVYCRVLPCGTATDIIRSHHPKGIVLSGRPPETTGGSPQNLMSLCDRDIFNLDVPVLGVVFGSELPCETVCGDTLSTTETAEKIHAFLYQTCQCTGGWTMAAFAEEQIAEIRQKVGSEQVICGLSGGVDSAVVAAILSKAIGSQLTCIFVDSGLMRKNEMQAVRDAFEGHFHLQLQVVDAQDRFLQELAGVLDPQEKRLRIGHTFIDVFADAAKHVQGAKFLAQGTIYPDILESGGSADSPAAVIKLHHNVGGLPEDLEFDLIEPLRHLFKDEVRKLGEHLGLPEDLVWRHPFPGPGLAVRCLGEVVKDRLDILREADSIVVDEIQQAGWYRQVSQVFAILLPVQSVGVTNKQRTYENACCVRCVETEDFMSAQWVHLPPDLLERISSRIIREVVGINRVVYDISSKPPATIEWE